MRFAWKIGLTQEQMTALLAALPKWVATDRFDIQARADGHPTKDQTRLMVRALLKERFGLEAHIETRQGKVLAMELVRPGKPGPKLVPLSELCDDSGAVPCGARSLLVSNWSVPSQATVKLVTGAFDELAKDPSIGRAEALRRAEIAMLDPSNPPEFAHPMMWAPFVLVGEGGAGR